MYLCICCLWGLITHRWYEHETFVRSQRPGRGWRSVGDRAYQHDAGAREACTSMRVLNCGRAESMDAIRPVRDSIIIMRQSVR